jgi:hypothetical protein
VVNALNKSKIVANKTSNELFEEQKERLREIQCALKEQKREEDKNKRLLEAQRKKESEARSYDRIMKVEKMTSLEASADTSAAQAYEEDFF